MLKVKKKKKLLTNCLRGYARSKNKFKKDELMNSTKLCPPSSCDFN